MGGASKVLSTLVTYPTQVIVFLVRHDWNVARLQRFASLRHAKIKAIAVTQQQPPLRAV